MTTATHMFHSNNDDSIVQPRSFSVDEFSDFQSAPSIPVNPMTSGRSFGLAFDSPRHVHHSIPNKPSSFNPPLVSTTGNGCNKESIVGSRLANYDLGTMSPRINQPQHQNASVIVNSSSTFQGSTNGDNLLIGEEDKYSALRGLIDEIPVTQPQQPIVGTINSTTQVPNYVSHVEGNIEHKISFVNDDVLEIVKTETMDFGEFQSFDFTSESNTYPLYPSAAVNNNNNHVNKSNSFEASQRNDLLDMNFAMMKGNPNTKKSSNNDGWLTNSTTTVSPQTEQNSSSFNDGDFGDFVSFSGRVENPVIPASPKIVLKSELCKKSSSSSSKSKKPSQGVAKISLSRIAKASNILIESPTYPKPTTATADLNNISSFDDQQFSYYQPNHSLESSFDLMTNEGFDFSLPSPTSGGSSQQVQTVEFGAPLKTTLIGSSASDDDDFGDFATVHQVPIVDSTIDLLPFTKPKLNCPAAETQSLASLDLGNYLESGDGKSLDNEASPDSSEALEFEPYMKEELIISRTNDLTHEPMQTDLSFQVGFPPHVEDEQSEQSSSEDKYKCFKEEIESERERYNAEWNRCLTSCLNLISYGQSIFNSASSSEVIREIISNDKGYAYIQNLIEVYLVASRIYQSWKRRSGISQSWKKLDGGVKIKQLYDEICQAWESLTPFFIGTPIMEIISKVDDSKEGDYSDCSKLCGVCLYNTDTESLLDYGGKYYHANCANLYINEVDSILPSLYTSML